MSSVFDHQPEMGGHVQERRAVLHAQGLQVMLEIAAKHYWNQAFWLQVILRILILATTVVAVIHTVNVSNGAPGKTELTTAIVVLPLLVGMMATIYAAYRPVLKFGACLSAAKRIEGEVYKYRSRVTPYRATKRSAQRKSHRELFSENCGLIWKDVAESDVRAGSVARSKDSTLSMRLWTDIGSDEKKLDSLDSLLKSRLKLPKRYSCWALLDADTYIKDRLTTELKAQRCTQTLCPLSAKRP